MKIVVETMTTNAAVVVDSSFHRGGGGLKKYDLAIGHTLTDVCKIGINKDEKKKN